MSRRSQLGSSGDPREVGFTVRIRPARLANTPGSRREVVLTWVRWSRVVSKEVMNPSGANAHRLHLRQLKGRRLGRRNGLVPVAADWSSAMWKARLVRAGT